MEIIIKTEEKKREGGREEKKKIAYLEGFNIVLETTEDMTARSKRSSTNQKVGENHLIAAQVQWVTSVLRRQKGKCVYCMEQK